MLWLCCFLWGGGLMLTRNKAVKLVGQPFIDEKDGFAWGCL